MYLLDTHTHLWRYRAEDYPWIDQSRSAIARDFLVTDLEGALASGGIDAAILVQARHSVQETEWLLEVADESARVAGVIGWVDLCAPDVARQLDLLSARPLLLGIRHIVHDEPDDLFMRRADFRRGLAMLAGRGLSYDLLLFPRHLPVAIDLVAEFPDQTFVLDHLAKPDIRAGTMQPWRADLDRLARFPHVYAKISGLVTEADWDYWTDDELRPYMQSAYDAFGPARLMLGSDWPVCTLAGSYERTMSVALEFVARLPASEQAAIRGENAARVWALDRPKGRAR
jgi:L-fuconolactonase